MPHLHLPAAGAGSTRARPTASGWDEIAHTNPLWLHRRDAARLGVGTGDLVRVETEIGHFVLKAWVTEGIKPGVVACSHHMGRWKLADGAGPEKRRRGGGKAGDGRKAARGEGADRRETGRGASASSWRPWT